MQDLSSTVDRIRQKHRVPALAVAIVQEGEEQCVVSGVRKIGSEALVTKDDKFRFRSCGKAITAFVIRKLVEEEKLSYDTTLVEFFGTDIHEALHNVTIGHLLTHISGLSRDSGFLSEPPEHVVGEYHYSNLGYVVLGLIIEQLLKKSFVEVVDEYVFQPLEMNTAGFGVAAIVENDEVTQPVGHGRDSETGELIVCNEDSPEFYRASGRIHASLPDWMKFLKHELNQPHERYLESNSYTLSALVQSQQGGYWNQGSNRYHNAKHVLMPDQDAAYVIVSNDGSANARAAIDELEAHIKEQILTPELINMAKVNVTDHHRHP